MATEQKTVVQPVSRTREILSQIVACLALDLLLIDLGMSICFVTIVLPEVLHAKEGISLNESQASWFGSMAFLCQPLGGIVSGPILDYFGRKRALILVNVPHLIAWVLMYSSWDVASLFVANALLGFGTGVMEAPSITYVGEISQASIRGVLTTLTNGFTAIGMFTAYLLGKMLSWRQAALVSLVVPVTTMLLVLLVPETPIWLLSKGRQKEALESLCRLRGWAPPRNVKEEFDVLVEHNESNSKCVICDQKNDGNAQPCDHASKGFIKKIILKIRYVFFSKETIRPFSLVMAYFFFYTFSGFGAIRPNMVNVCRALGMAYDPKTIVVFVGAIFIGMSMVSAMAIKLIGKRKLVISSMFATSCCALALSVYSKKNISPHVFSYEPNTFPEETSVVPVALFLSFVCFTSLGIPWVLLSEVFPFRSRGIATGLAAACTYLFFFIATKTNYNIESMFHISGAFAIYSTFGLMGTVYLYLFLPETENVSLVEIESLYKGDRKIFANDPFINMFIKKKNVQQTQPMLS